MRKIECETIDIMLPGNQVIGETVVMVTILILLEPPNIHARARKKERGSKKRDSSTDLQWGGLQRGQLRL